MTQKKLNREQLQVIDLINNTSLSIFLSGKAGTGKTQLIRELSAFTYKKFVIVAPTGIASVNAGGVTIHSLFQLQVGAIYTPETKIKVQLSSEKRALLERLDLLVIDECSMLRADVLDNIDAVLKHVRKTDRPFGGLQILFVGDLFQLSPVIARCEWDILKRFYKSAYFIHSLVYKRSDPIYIELSIVYRQNDPTFIDVLNSIRTGSVSSEVLAIINARVIFGVGESQALTLTTHNNLAEQINTGSLMEFPGDIVEIEAFVDQDFDLTSVLAERVLRLKVGVPVMLIRNLEERNKHYYNGQIGKVVNIKPESIEVEFDDELVAVTQALWQSFDYEFNESAGTVKGKVKGSLQQFPLRLAWGITIHKSQGLTFETAMIQIEKSFTAGQVYVALSRVRSLQGVSLSSPITLEQVKVDPVVTGFLAACQSTDDHDKKIRDCKDEFIESVLRECFNFQGMYGTGAIGTTAATKPIADAISSLIKHGNTFTKQLHEIMTLPQEQRFQTLADRLKSAVNYFENICFDLLSVIQERIKSYQDDIVYKLVQKELKALRVSVKERLAGLAVAKQIATKIAETQDLGAILQ